MDQPPKFACFACRSTRWPPVRDRGRRTSLNCTQCLQPMQIVRATASIPDADNHEAWQRLKASADRLASEIQAAKAQLVGALSEVKAQGPVLRLAKGERWVDPKQVAKQAAKPAGRQPSVAAPSFQEGIPDIFERVDVQSE